MLRRTVAARGLFDPVYDRNAGGSHQKRKDTLPSLGPERRKAQKWNREAMRTQYRRVPYAQSSVSTLIPDAEEAVSHVHRDTLDPRQRRAANRQGLILCAVIVGLYYFTVWRFGQDVFDDVVIPDFSDEDSGAKQ